ncbi:MAG: glutaminyl-peptide cyclotransferase [Odoribacter sp.]|nr:glutaminyl-peptide cyclotransferase [Odoribacter sp.]
MRLYYIWILILFLACNGNKPKAEKVTEQQGIETVKGENNKYINSIVIDSPARNKIFDFNEIVEVKYSIKEKSDIDSVQVFVNNEKVTTLGKDELVYNLTMPSTKAGHNVLRLMAYHTNGKIGVASQNFTLKPDVPPHQYDYTIVKEYPHDTKAYTQGFVYQDGYMYEGTGQYGSSSIRKIDMNTGKVLSVLSIESNLFGEGITIFKNKIYQLTWTSRKGFVYDLKTFTLESTFSYNTEGWGLTTMGEKLIMSDGTNKLYHITPSSFNIIKQVEVYDHNGAVSNLNELEYINGLVWANIWTEDRIVMIDPESGAVKGELNMNGLLSASDRNKLTDEREDVLNGIAYDSDKDTVFLTGKRWPKIFEIKIK